MPSVEIASEVPISHELSKESQAPIIIIGATNGIGLEAARNFAKEGYPLVIGGRNEAKCQQRTAEFSELAQKEIPYHLIDAASFKSTNNFIQEIVNRYQETGIQALIYVVGTTQEYAGKTVTEDNLEISFQTNTLTFFHLSKHLAPLIRKAEGKIVCISSGFAFFYLSTPETDLAYQSDEQIAFKPSFGPYSRSKVVLSSIAYEMNSRLDIPTYVFDPYWVDTSLSNTGPLKKIKALVPKATVSPESVGRVLFELAAADKKPGYYLYLGKSNSGLRFFYPPASQRPPFRERMWNLCDKLSAEYDEIGISEENGTTKIPPSTMTQV